MGVLRVPGRAQGAQGPWVLCRGLSTLSIFAQDDQEEEMPYYGNLPSRPCEPEPIYANTVPRKPLSASRNFEVSDKYSTIKKPKARF